MRIPGSDLPMRISTGRSGVTRSWSKVPASRSRATDRAVTTRVTTRVRSPTMPGTMNQRDSRLGLYQARISSRAGGLRPPWRSAQAML